MKLKCKSKELAKLRMNQGMSGTTLSIAIGLERNTISNLESGRRNVSASKAIKICKYFDVELEFLFEIIE